MAYCEEYVELISAAIDGVLSPAEQEKLSAHLSACSECQQLFDDLSALHAAMTGLPPAEVPTGLKGRIMDAVAEEAADAKILPFAPKKSTVRWQRWLASAAVLALVVLGTWSWKPWESYSSANPPQSAVAGAADRDIRGFTSKTAPAAPAPIPDPASAPAPESADSSTLDISAAELGQLNGYADTAAPRSVSESGSDSPASAETTFTTEGTGPLDYEPTAKVAPGNGDAAMPTAAGAALPSEAPAVYGYSWSWGGSGDAETGSASSALEEDAPLALESTAMPRLYSIAPTAQSVSAPQAAPVPAPAEEGELEQAVTSQAEAVNVLANYIYEFVGDVELVEDDSAASYAVNSPTGVSGVITCVGEDEDAYFLDYRDDLTPDVFHYSVNKQTSQVTLLEQVPAPAAEDTVP